MGDRPILKAEELETLSHDERARLVTESLHDSLDDLDPAFKAKIEARGRKILEDRGVLDPGPT